MNIFVLDAEPEASAEQHCDSHVVKMVLEATQMLSTAHHALDGERAMAGIYRPTHPNHPCSKFVRTNSWSYDWTLRYALALSREYTRRYGKVHACAEKLRLLGTHPANIPTDRTPVQFAQAMPDEFKGPDAVAAYRRYYETKSHFAKWRHGPTPKWWKF